MAVKGQERIVAVKTFKITYLRDGEEDETVEADNYVDRDEWIEFVRQKAHSGGVSSTKVLRVRSQDVERIDLIEE